MRKRWRNPRGLALQSTNYRGTLNMVYLATPHHGAEFVTLFLDDVHETWLKLFEIARLHLGEIVSIPLHLDNYLLASYL